MQSISAKEAKYGFGRLIDLARAEPVVGEEHGRLIVVLAIEGYEKLRDIANGAAALEALARGWPGKSIGMVKT